MEIEKSQKSILNIPIVVKTYINSLKDQFLYEDTSNLSIKINKYTIELIEAAIKNKNYSGANALIYSYFPLLDETIVKNPIIDSQGEELKESHPASLVTNFFKNRVLLFVNDTCPNYCRFCFRREKIGEHKTIHGYDPTQNKLLEAFDYIKQNKTIREVILSGGEPLSLNNAKIEFILKNLKSIEHIKIIRIDTKILAFLPDRINDELIQILRSYKPIYIIGHFVHSVELTEKAICAISKLVDSGITVMSHTPLLKNINDSTSIIEELMFKLISNRVIPHYIVHYIPTQYTEQFRISIKEGTEIISRLLGRLSGIALPKYILNLPEGGGKVHLTKSRIIKNSMEGYYFENFEEREIFYPEPL